MNRNMMDSLVHKVIKVDRGGPESRVGKLMAVKDDYITLFTEKDGVVYYNNRHIKSVTLNTKGEMKFENEIPEDLDHLDVDDFRCLVKHFKHHWIKINRGGPEMLEGVLDEVHDDYVIIISKEEVIRLSIFHIRNISHGVKMKNSNDSDNDNDNGNKNNGNKADGYRATLNSKRRQKDNE